MRNQLICLMSSVSEFRGNSGQKDPPGTVDLPLHVWRHLRPQNLLRKPQAHLYRLSPVGDRAGDSPSLLTALLRREHRGQSSSPLLVRLVRVKRGWDMKDRTEDLGMWVGFSFPGLSEDPGAWGQPRGAVLEPSSPQHCPMPGAPGLF